MEIMSGKSRTAGGLGSEWFSFYWLSVLVKHCSARRTHSHQVGAWEWSSPGKRRAATTSSACFSDETTTELTQKTSLSLWNCELCLLPCKHNVRSLISVNGGAVKQVLIWLHKLSIKPNAAPEEKGAGSPSCELTITLPQPLLSALLN